MNNLNRAKELLASDSGYTCVAVRGEKTYTSCERGIAPLVAFINSGADLSGFSVADKIVGRAAALLYNYLNISELYGEIVSEGAKNVCEQGAIALSYTKIVPHIINRKGDGICPIEQAVSGISDPTAALTAIREALAKFKLGN